MISFSRYADLFRVPGFCVAVGTGLAPREMLAESFTWGATCLLGGISSGITAAGMLAEHFAPSVILVAAAALALLAGAVVWATLEDEG